MMMMCLLKSSFQKSFNQKTAMTRTSFVWKMKLEDYLLNEALKFRIKKKNFKLCLNSMAHNKNGREKMIMERNSERDSSPAVVFFSFENHESALCFSIT